MLHTLFAIRSTYSIRVTVPPPKHGAAVRRKLLTAGDLVPVVDVVVVTTVAGSIFSRAQILVIRN